MKSRILLLTLLTAACGLPEAPPPPDPMPIPDELKSSSGELQSIVQVDSINQELVVYAGPFNVPAMEGPSPSEMMLAGEGGGHDHGERTPMIRFDWPMDAWFKGFSFSVAEADGSLLPTHIMHHAIGVNYDRRQLVYEVPERLIGVGTETEPVLLPDFLGVPLEEGMRLGVYAMWHNDTGRDLDEVYLRLAIPWSPSTDSPEAVFPIYMDVDNGIGTSNTWDMNPGTTVQSYEFEMPIDGALLAAGGHMHDYGQYVRLEDVETGEVLVELIPDLDADGKILSLERKIFRKFFNAVDDRLILEGGRRYRVIGEYDSPLDHTLVEGAMAHIVGLFAPVNPDEWPAIDHASDVYALDISGLPMPADGSMHPGQTTMTEHIHDEGMDMTTGMGGMDHGDPPGTPEHQHTGGN